MAKLHLHLSPSLPIRDFRSTYILRWERKRADQSSLDVCTLLWNFPVIWQRWEAAMRRSFWKIAMGEVQCGTRSGRVYQHACNRLQSGLRSEA